MIQKQALDISFAQGLDQKTDPKRVQVGKFTSLQNSVFTKEGLLTKRNGYAQLSTLPNNTYAYLTTLNGNLTAVGTSIAALDNGNETWVQKGNIQPMTVNTLPLLTNNFNQTAVDCAVASNGLVCTVYSEFNGTATVYKYAVSDSITGQNIVAPTILSGSITSSRVFILGNEFVVLVSNSLGLQYFTIGIYSPTTIGSPVTISSTYSPSYMLTFDGFVVGTNLYIAYGFNSETEVAVTYLPTIYASQALPPVPPIVYTGQTAVGMSVTADLSVVSTPIYISWFNTNTNTGYNASVSPTLGPLYGPVTVYAGVPTANMVSAAMNGVCTIFVEVINAYGFDASLPTNYVSKYTVTAGTPAFVAVSARSIGLGSKAFIVSGVIYYLGAFQSTYQNTYFLINGSLSTEASPVVSAKLAYENGGGYLTTGLPSVTVIGTTAWIPYLYKDLIEAVNKDTAGLVQSTTAPTQIAGIYSQTGITLASLDIGVQGLDTAEIGNDLHLSGGFLWMYDGYLPVEHNFFLFPDTDIANPTDMAVWSPTGGNMAGEPTGWVSGVPSYYYQFTYEWTDNKGNAFRSAPSVPVAVTTSGGAILTGSVTLNIPTLRLTYKTANPVKIVIYRWSVGQQIYYQTTSITAPLLNNTTIDYVTYVDTNSDATILGNNIIYTTGGVLEDVNAPASNILTLFDTRLWLVDAEDQNLLWFSKQVIETVPAEMSDLLTMYIAPTTGSEGSTGPITALAPMDDKLIIFKQNAIYYINGTGPDNTGANSQYSQPIFITSTVGCANQQSIVFMPQGLMFQSNKGIWLLGRDLNTQYIGAPVENFNSSTVESAQNIPSTNQVRFLLNTGTTLMYDYYFGQWGTFVGVPGVSSCIFQNLHTFMDQYARVFQETVGLYQDGTNPVLMQFTTGPINFGTLQGYQRAYFFYLLGTYLTPHKLWVSVAYDYNPAPEQSFLIQPTNYSPAYGQPGPYGQGTPYGGPGSSEDWRVFLQRQRCQAISISVQEIFDSTLAVSGGAGLTLSGINMVLGFKKGFRPQSSAGSVG
jgi:hypothetical protein